MVSLLFLGVNSTMRLSLFFIFEKILRVDCYIYNNKMTYILNILIMKIQSPTCDSLHNTEIVYENYSEIYLYYTVHRNDGQETVPGDSVYVKLNKHII